jgi:polysaccharide biosynthesis PFTS motif protein
MLEKSSVDSDYWQILFESFLSIFKIDSYAQSEYSNSFIRSTDNSTFDISTGALRIGSRRALRGFFRSTLFISLMIMATFFPKIKRNSADLVLLFGFENRLVENDKAICSLIQNLKTIFPDLLKDNGEFLFESRQNAWVNSLSSKSKTYPYVALRIFRAEYSFKSRLSALCSVLKLASRMVRKNWNLFFLAPERAFLELPIWQFVLTDLQVKLLTTQSKLELLPVAFYAQTKNRSMIWYSNNSLPFNKIGHKSIVPGIAANADSIDHHYVWSGSHKLFLEHRYPTAGITVVGPILFEVQDFDASKRLQPEGILYFDVTPFDNLEYETFYTPRMCSEAIADLSEVAQELKCRLHLKPKRPYLQKQGSKLQHSVSYLKQLAQLEDEKLITRLDSSALITESILNYQVVIGLPFTSPVLASSKLNRPSAYYVPLETGDWEIQSERDGISVLKGKKQLFEYLTGVINEKRET